MSLRKSKNMRILSLNSGGVKGFLLLLMLERIFRTIQRDNDLSKLIRPCDYFDQSADIDRPFFNKDDLEAAVKGTLKVRGLGEDLPLRDFNVPCKV